jgi:tetraacyldisaccharide 4'-kinase
VVANGNLTGLVEDEILMQARPTAFVRVVDDHRVDCDAFVAMHRDVHAVAGIGNPSRFALTLRELGLEPQLHPLPDHHRYRGDEVLFDDDWHVVVTEKDATKLRRLSGTPANCWYLEIDTAMDPGAEEKLRELLRVHGIGS